MKADYTLFEVTVTPLTPLHVGSGTLLLKDYDFAVQGNATWRINEDALLEAQNVDDTRLAETLARTPPAQLLKPADFRLDSPYFRYRLVGKPRAMDAGAQLQEQLKTARDEVFLPGSSLKGAIRTALAWHGWTEKGLKPDVRDLERNRKFAGQRLEREIFGADPNHDLLRALQVSDSAPAGKDRLLVLNAQVVTRGSLGSPIELEAVQPDTPFHLTFKVDRALFNQWARTNGFRLGGNPGWLVQLPEFIQRHTNQRLKAEAAWFKERAGAEQTANFYQQLLQAQLPAQSCLLQLGWGTGWSDKTYGSHLQQDQGFMEQIIADYRLAMGQRRKGDPFPKSRRVTARVVKDQAGKTQQRPGLPLGWVLMELKERS
ncbi:MAG: type III-A CRISPR-associated RAMP protein Csm5 [Anaerolineales bacterium]|nr:type III-A CRISPR-associated RAMP protein Csm5 [Anaerolineales bacterium]